jgi:homocysteine S-methyltransferase
MTTAQHRNRLPQLAGGTFLTDGGLETELVFHDGVDLPAFASFPLATEPGGRERLARYYEDYLETARRLDAGFVLEAPTWRANPDWGATVGFDRAALVAANHAAIDLLVGLRERMALARPVVISGCIGPRGDGYRVDTTMTAAEAEAYHAFQIGVLAETAADLVSAYTMTYVDEAVGIAAAAAFAGIPAVISFTVETDGRLASGLTLGEAIEATDDATGAYPAYYMVNCAHPLHLDDALQPDAAWATRIGGYRPNASARSHAELDEATELDEGDPADLAERVVGLRSAFPNLSVVGGCCGTDHRHVDAIARAWCGQPMLSAGR